MRFEWGREEGRYKFGQALCQLLLDKDVTKVFRTPEAVLHALHSLIDVLPYRAK